MNAIAYGRGTPGHQVHHRADSELLADALAGLTRHPKSIPPKHFYDARGSALFDRITELPEYYPTRTELGILREHAPAMAEAVGTRVVLVEFGSGSSTKVGLLLDALEQPGGYVAVDISAEHLVAATEALSARRPGLPVVAVAADYTRPFPLPVLTGRPVGFFPGSTIGNLHPDEAVEFLADAYASLGQGSSMIVGVDLRKDRAVLEAAYDDAAGVTAAFNLNLLRRLNREAGADFDIDAFTHRAFYDTALGRIEMHLVSARAQVARLAGVEIPFAAGETIHTECSYKYSMGGFRELARQAGWQPEAVWTDAREWFSVHLLRG